MSNELVSPQKKQFEETILRAIRRCESDQEMLGLMQMINETEIRFNHSNIIDGIRSYFSFGGARKFSNFINLVVKGLEMQKSFYDSSVESKSDYKTQLQAEFDGIRPFAQIQ